VGILTSGASEPDMDVVCMRFSAGVVMDIPPLRTLYLAIPDYLVYFAGIGTLDKNVEQLISQQFFRRYCCVQADIQSTSLSVM
jgi:hypothetical protein